MTLRLDDIDKRILYRLSQDARNIKATEIAKETNVSPGTIRNRIERLEERGIVKGYHADIDYEKTSKRLLNLFKCSSRTRDRAKLAKKALQVSGVINVREVMTGEGDLHIKAVGKNTDDIAQISEKLTDLGMEIEDEDLIQREHFHPYHSFGPEDEQMEPLIDLRRITGNAETANLTIRETAPVTGKTVEEINKLGLLNKNILLVAIEREDKTITPKGDTIIKSGDIVTLFSPSEIDDKTLQAFTEEK
ncbi:AsnC family transcriptional regulator [candidate division MSBL1 archaeon SCGC-AAA382A13]|uniref:AsnC family transcriptional regulator n=1 Tax=candidate division MSBL1 archaeon SCGC-AAA382A13 TaxID=1698279 RepID=A0A133VG41_9EURY|nr:AsnC family transcriptional regulator [candidate division MSBL1 archaeon SCGC-AAA382A13]